jgi:hypothetical protein
MEKGSGRFKGVDALRGTAVLLMVFSHGLHWAYPGTAHDIILLFGSLSPGKVKNMTRKEKILYLPSVMTALASQRKKCLISGKGFIRWTKRGTEQTRAKVWA